MSYNTRQRELILDYIKKNAKKHLTADDIADALKAEQVGKTTVYRYLEKLCEQNIVRKFILSEGKSACYQYNDEQQCHDHFHMKCLKCGRLFHLECDHLKDIAAHISKMHDFTIDSSRTVFTVFAENVPKRPRQQKKRVIYNEVKKKTACRDYCGSNGFQPVRLLVRKRLFKQRQRQAENHLDRISAV